MDLQSLTEVATVVTKLKMYPYFDIANYILMSLMVRDDNHPPATGTYFKIVKFHIDSADLLPISGAQSFSRKHPLSCWVSTMLLCNAAGIITNFLVGESPIAPFKDHQALLTATFVW